MIDHLLGWLLEQNFKCIKISLRLIWCQIEDYQGRKGINVGFNGLIKPLTKSPKLTLMANLFYHHLDQEAFDNRIFEMKIIGWVFSERSLESKYFSISYVIFKN